MKIHATGWNFTPLSIFGVGPKWTFQCKKCHYGWSQRLTLGVSKPLIVCPHCKQEQILPIEYGE